MGTYTKKQGNNKATQIINIHVAFILSSFGIYCSGLLTLLANLSTLTWSLECLKVKIL